MNSASILVVEDEELLGRMLCDNLALDGHVAEHIRRGDLALERLGEARFDLVILDVMLPGLDGLRVLEELRGREDDTPVLILSARSGDQDKIRGLERKADDYLTKPFNLTELMLRVSALLRRAQTRQKAIQTVRIGEALVDFAAQTITHASGANAEMSASETRLLRVLAQHAGSVVTRQEIVSALFGSKAPPTVRTVDNLVLRLRKLLEDDARKPAFLHTVRGVGFRLDGCREDS